MAAGYNGKSLYLPLDLLYTYSSSNKNKVQKTTKL